MGWQAKPRYDAGRNQWTLRHHGKKYYLCAGANNEAEAWSKARAIQGPSTHDSPTTLRSVVDACAHWLLTYHPPDSKDAQWYRDHLIPFMRWAQGVSLDSVEPTTLKQYLSHLKRLTYDRGKSKSTYSTRTIRHRMQYARAVLEDAHQRGALPSVPPMPKLPPMPKTSKDISPEDLVALFEELPKRARPVLYFIVATGCRPTEGRLLQWSEVKDGFCVLRRGKTPASSGRERIIPLNPDATAIIEAQASKGKRRGYVFTSRTGEPYTVQGLRSIMRRAAERAGVEGITGTYQLRHTFAQSAYDSGMLSLDMVGAALGHVDGSVATKVYAHTKQQRLQEAVQSLTAPASLDPVPPERHETPSSASRSRGSGKRSIRKTAKARSRQVG